MLTDQEAAFVQNVRIGHLATANAAGEPHVIPACFVYLSGAFYSVIDEKPKRGGKTLRRLLNIEENPRAALVFDRYEEDWSRLAWVMVRGTASILKAGAEYEAAITALNEKYPQYRSMRLGAVIRVAPENVASWQA